MPRTNYKAIVEKLQKRFRDTIAVTTFQIGSPVPKRGTAEIIALTEKRAEAREYLELIELHLPIRVITPAQPQEVGSVQSPLSPEDEAKEVSDVPD